MTAADPRAVVADLGATGTAGAYRAGTLDPLEVCEALLAAARHTNESHVFITRTATRALREAAASRQRYRQGRPRGALDGVPVVWKDLFDIAGTRTTAGSATRAEAPMATTDAAVVRILTDAGTVGLGKTNLSEFAFSGLGINRRFGTPVNPLDPRRIPGGSSSGSAVAVAMGLAPVAIGTDTSGSVRVPAAFCGVVGFKASTGRYDSTGMVPLAPTLDSVGVLARRVKDVSAVDAALTGPPPMGTTPGNRPRLVVPVGELVEDCSPCVSAAFEEVLVVLAKGGFRIESRELTGLRRAQELMDEHGPLVVAEAYERYGELLRRPDPLVDPAVLRRLATFDPRGRGYLTLRRELPALRAQIRSELDGSLLVFPTVRDPAPELAPLLADGSRYDAANRRVLRSTMLTSYLNMPGVSLPSGPGGLLLSATAGEDSAVLTAARTVEKMLGPVRLPRPTGS